MAALDRISLASNLGISPDVIRRIASEAIWRWYDEHKNEEILKISLWFIHKTYYIEDLTHLPIGGNIIERIAGPRSP